MTDLKHISKGNKKTECFSFDIPARITCPGKTKECSKDCYAAQMMAMYPSTNKKYARNHEFALHTTDTEFVHYMIREIPDDCDFRIHISGDFYSVEYVRRWRTIALARPDVTFYAYTRSWRVNEQLTESIWWLNLCENVNVNLSVDDETGEPLFDGAEYYRWCYLTKTDNVPDWIRENDIVFRSNHSGKPGGHKWKRKRATKQGLDPDVVAPLIKRLGGQVCPLEQGRDIPGFSCKKCTLCVVKPRVLTSV